MRSRSPYASVLQSERREWQRRTLKCGFVVDPFPSAGHLLTSQTVAQNRFIRDMGKQGWQWLGGDFVLSGPVPNIDPGLTPRRSHQVGEPSQYVQDVPALDKVDSWLYFVATDFIRRLPVGMEILIDEDDPVNYSKEIMDRRV